MTGDRAPAARRWPPTIRTGCAALRFSARRSRSRRCSKPPSPQASSSSRRRCAESTGRLRRGPRHGVRVRERRQRRSDLRARVVIAADGRGSRARIRARTRRASRPSPRRWAFGAYFSDVDGLTTAARCTCGTTATSASRRCRAARERLRRPRHCAGAVRPPRAAINRDPSALARRASRLARALRAAHAGLAGDDAGPAGGGSRARRDAPGLLLAGDAAGFIDPMTGDGLRFALRGGELAAHAALARARIRRAGASSSSRLRAPASSRGKWRLNRALRLARRLAAPSVRRGCDRGTLACGVRYAAHRGRRATWPFGRPHAGARDGYGGVQRDGLGRVGVGRLSRRRWLLMMLAEMQLSRKNERAPAQRGAVEPRATSTARCAGRIPPLRGDGGRGRAVWAARPASRPLVGSAALGVPRR